MMTDVNELSEHLVSLNISPESQIVQHCKWKNKNKNKTKKNKKKDGKRVMMVVPGKQFHHSSINHSPSVMPRFFSSSKEVALFQNNHLYSLTEKNLVPQLKSDVAMLAQRNLLESRELKRPYLGINLYENQDKYELMDSQELDDSISCFKYMESWEEQNKSIYGLNRKFIIISARHNIVDIAMIPFTKQNGSVSLTCLFRPGNILSLSRDLSDTSGTETGANSKDTFTRKICFSGFALEDVLTEGITEKRKPIFSIVENILDNNITLLLRCEMDAFNPVTKTFTELKCYSLIKYSNPNHRRKLLKTWIQTGLIPNSDVVVGIRDTQNGDLTDIFQFDREHLYKKLANRNLPQRQIEWNFNPLLSTEWLAYALKTITTTVQKVLDKIGSENALAFNIKIDTNLNIKVELTDTPSLY
ncbi:Decapping and exoribonuclease protein 1 [Nakaseomyces bracarensis]|uniref:Decapping nuclease n=1 Tax=Nakaseomyces bracarensis TaxID=273131 RepID=A0ABR4P0G1_9SACH